MPAVRPTDLDTHLAHVLRLVARHVARHGHRMVQADGRLSDLYVSIREVRRTLGYPDDEGWERTEPMTERAGLPDLAEAAAAVEDGRAALTVDAGGALGRICGLFGLSEGQRMLLMAAAAPALSVDVARLYTFAWADFAVKRPTVGFLAELLSDTGDAADVRRWVSELDESGTLVSRRLVDVQGEGSLIHRSVGVVDAVIAELMGRPRRPPAWVELPTAPPADPATLFAPKDAAQLVERLAAGRTRLLLIGPRGAGRRTTLAAHLGAQPLVVSLDRLSPDAAGASALAEAAREALLLGRCLLVRGDGVVDSAEVLTQRGPDLQRVLDVHPGPLAITALRPSARLHRFVSGLVELAMPPVTSEQQRAVWTRALGGAAVAEAASEGVDLPGELVGRFELPPGAIHEAVDDARSRAGLLDEARVGLDDLVRAVRRRSDHALAEIAEPFDTTLSWGDAVLPEATEARLKEVLSHARHREQVLDAWGFRRKLSYGQGLSCLFAGPPGTGKTMMAGVLARALGREIYRVDVSRITSKWVGETEKNLARVFEEAERAQVILLFDEADSLFSTRTEVKSSNDRFANMQVNFLLQQMESYDGVTVLTTNFEASIDEAFKRRIRFWVTFPFPDAAQRTRLWRSMIPADAPLDPDIPAGDWDALGEEFELSGGSIKNAALRAAFYAAASAHEPADPPAGRPGVITFDRLWDAATAETRDLGKLIRH